MKKIKHLPQLLLSILIAQSAGIVGSFFTTPQIDGWYSTLVRPEISPPSWVFGPVWITLFTLMGIAAFIVWQKEKRPVCNSQNRVALQFYGFQLLLNAFWSMLFFGAQSPEWAFQEILLLLTFILITTLKFWKISRWAGILFLPYLLWVLFAAILNYQIWQLNIG
jgi:benzodiazapine receptor